MRGLSKQFNTRVVMCCAVFGAAGLAGLVAGLAARDGNAPVQSGIVSINLSPAESIEFRFPQDWQEAAPVLSATYAMASAGDTSSLFSPQPTYTVASAGAVMPVPSQPTLAMASASAVPLPRPSPHRHMQTADAHSGATTTVAAVAPKPLAPKSSAVLNSAQIAGIKKRLNLTPEQEQYWPAVEAELRKMEYRKGSKGETRVVDMTKVDTDALRSAGFPLVMSFSDDQRRELKSLAHLLGLEGAMRGL
jgi:hypothetical protein